MILCRTNKCFKWKVPVEQMVGFMRVKLKCLVRDFDIVQAKQNCLVGICGLCLCDNTGQIKVPSETTA